MPARLFCKTGELAGAHYEIGREATIGSSSSNSIVLAKGTISRAHARLSFDPAANCYVLEDLNSQNGTRLDGAPVKHTERLEDLHVITFAEHHDFIFHAAGGHTATRPGPMDDETREESKTMYEPGTVPHLPSDLGRATPEVTSPPGAPSTVFRESPGFAVPSFGGPTGPAPTQESTGVTRAMSGEEPTRLAGPIQPVGFVLEWQDSFGHRVYPLVEGQNLVGRKPSCQIQSDDITLSREHAVVIVGSGKVLVKDLNSANGTFVRGKKATTEVEVRPGDDVKFGEIEARLGAKD